jgi:cobalt-zinc-cadmium efflux system membrane fusion protein
MRRAPAALALGLLAIAAACRRSEPAEAVAPPGETWLSEAQIRGGRLVIEPAGRRNLALHLVTAGRVAFDEARVAHVFSPVSGRITRVVGALGRRVPAGEPLAVLESPDLASAWSDLIKARADQVAAGHERDRQKNLFEHDAGSERDAEAARDNAEKADAEVQRAELRLQLLHAAPQGQATQEFLLRSPIAGEIVARTATPGLEVQGMLSSANVVQELFTVGELDPVWVWGDVYERDLGRVRPGQPTSITSVAYPGRRVEGTIDYVASSLDPQTHTLRVRCVVPNPERLLKPEMYVTLRVQLERGDALALPRGAVIKAGDRQTVFVEDGKAPDGRTRFLQRAVALGEADDGWVAIASGLEEGEKVVVSGSILLSGGSESP